MTGFGRRVTALAAVGVLATGLLGAPPTAAATPPPPHVFAPYFETWTSASITGTATASSARYFTLAFLQTTGKSSCTLAWGGSKSQTVTAGRYLSDIASLRAMRGDVIPSLGGWSADQGGTEIGDSCKDVNAIATAYEQLVTTYDVTRLDMDIEGRSLTNAAGIDRRNKAIAQLQAWAATNGRVVQVQYTLPTTRTGLDPSSLAVLQNAVKDGVRIDLVNPMALDYDDGLNTDMGDSAKSALNGLHAQLATLLPGNTDAQIWALEGVTLMPGIDDYAQKTEITSLADAQEVLTFAQKNGMSAISMWAIQRDNGGCPGRGGSGSCSGISQNTWDFTHILAPFSGS